MSGQDFKPTYDSAIAFLRQRDIDQEPVNVIAAEIAGLRARLAALEAREPLVQALIDEIEPGEYPPAVDPQWPGAAPDFYPLDAKARAVRDFPLQPSTAQADHRFPQPGEPGTYYAPHDDDAPAPAEPSAADGGEAGDLLDDVPDHERVLSAAGYPKAASKMERLAAEVRRLREQVTSFEAQLHDLIDHHGHVAEECDLLRESNANQDARLTAMRIALTEAGIPESEPYPDVPVSEVERSLRAGGRVIGGVARVERLAAERDQLRAEVERLRELDSRWKSIERYDDASTKRILTLEAERDQLRDCGQDGVCVLSPGCVRHWEERNRELTSALASLQEDVRKAAGELLVEIPEPGSQVSRLLLANIQMRRERDLARDQLSALLATLRVAVKDAEAKAAR